LKEGESQETSDWDARSACGVRLRLSRRDAKERAEPSEPREDSAVWGQCGDPAGDIVRICETEKKQTNHWFVASEQGGELRVSGWNSRNRMRPGMKHLCGQTCLHKLVDEFMARTLAVRVQAGAVEDCVADRQVAEMNTSLISDLAYEQVESSARLIAPQVAALSKRPQVRPSAELVAMPGRLPVVEPAAPDEPPRYSSRNWRAEAWDRERERELRAVERRPEISARRRLGS